LKSWKGKRPTHAVDMMMVGPSEELTDRSFKPLYGAVHRKGIVLSDKEKAE
jgi:hypothetical protein